MFGQVYTTRTSSQLLLSPPPQPKIYFIFIGQVAEIKAIIDSARKEFTVEDNLQTITHTLSDLAFKYKINSNNIRVITNDAQVRDNFCW